MRRNLIVLGGVAILMITGYYVPVLSFSEKKWYMESMETMSITSAASMTMGFIILWFMQSTSKWRGVLWIVLSILGPLWTIKDVQQRYQFFIDRGIKVDPNYINGMPSYEIGLYLVLLGYIIVIVGSVWDIVHKRQEERLSITSSQTNAQETLSVEGKNAA